jgi:DNA ligase (NAD+)
VAVFQPVQIGGTEVTYASLHNEDRIRELGLTVGDRVRIHRAGYVIPQVLDVVSDAGHTDNGVWSMPQNCPACGTNLVRSADEAAVRCPNEGCSGRLKAALEYAVSKNVLDVANLGPNTLTKLVGAGVVRDVADIFTLDENALVAAGLGPKVAQNIAQAVNRAKGVELSRLLCALNIRYVAAQTAEDLANHFGSLEVISKADQAALQKVEGVGPKVAASVAEFFASDYGKALSAKLSSIGVVGRVEPKQASSDGPLSGKAFVITGSLSLKRNEVAQLIESMGGKVLSSVSKKTDYLVAGESPGSKLDKARELGIPILDDSWLRGLLGGQS